MEGDSNMHKKRDITIANIADGTHLGVLHESDFALRLEEALELVRRKLAGAEPAFGHFASDVIAAESPVGRSGLAA